MAKRERRTKKQIPDSELIRLNALGLSLRTIARTVQCHQTTVTLRLKDIGVSATDTRHSFMEDVLMRLPENQLNWVETKLGPHHSIKDFVTSLIVNAYIAEKNGTPP